MPASRRLSLSALLTLLALACGAEPSREILGPAGPEEFHPAPQGITVVHLWATWCAPCVKELPALDGFVRAGVPAGVKLVLVSTQEPLDRSRDFLADRGLVLETAADPSGSFRRFLRARAVPTTIILAPDGSEIERTVGAAPWEASDYRARLQLLAGKTDR